MAFTSHPPEASGRRAGRGLRIAGGITVGLAGLAFLAHLWLGNLWSGAPSVAELEIRPAHADLSDYALAPEPEPEVIQAQLPVAQPVPEHREPRPQRLTRTTDRDRPKPIRLGDVAWSVGNLEVARAEYQDGRQPLQGQGCSIRLGVAIPAVLADAIYSEVGGPVRARVTSNVYSIDYGYENKILVPMGTIVSGQVVGIEELTIDRGRIAVTWSQMTNPAGFGGDRRYTQVSLGDGWGASADGSGGMGGEVELQWGKIFAYAALVTLFNVAENEAFKDNPYGNQAAGTLGDIGNEVVRKSLDFKPKISVKEGSPAQIMVQKTTRVC